MITQFTVSSELQQFLSGIQSKALTNVIWNIDFPDGAPELPSNPSTIRRSLMFSMVAYSDEATPTLEYNCYIQNLDGTGATPVSVPRGLFS